MSDAAKPWWATSPDAGVVDLPPVTVGAVHDDSGNELRDAAGNPMIPGSKDQIISAIFALAQETRTMSDTILAAFDAAVSSIKEKIATLEANVAALDAKINTAQVPTGAVLTQAEVDTLKDIEASLQPIVQHVGLLATPATPPPAP